MGRLVEIAHFYDPEEAFCAKGFLQSRGIDTFIQNEHHLTTAPWLRVALGGYRLMTWSAFESDARQALKSIGANNASAGAATDDKEPESQQRRKRNWFWLPVAFGTSAPFLPPLRYDWIGFIQFVALILLYASIIVVWGFSIFS